MHVEAIMCLSNLKANLNNESAIIWTTSIKKMVNNSQEILLDSTYLTGDAQKRCQLNKYITADIMVLVGNLMKNHENLVADCLKLLRNISLDFKTILFNFLVSSTHTTDAMLLIFEHYLINEQTSGYFKSNEALFDSIILNNLATNGHIIVSTLLNQLVKQDGFFIALNQRLKLKLVEGLFILYDSKRLNVTTEIQRFFFNLVNDSTMFIHLLH
jgi:hypothetical protein